MSIVTKNGKRSDSTDLVRADAAASRTAPNESASVPRANLLPPEIGQRNRAKKTRRHMRMALVGIVIVAVGATGGAFAYNSLAQTRLAVAQSDATRLAAEQAKFGEVKAIQDHITLGAAARKVGGATDIDWSDYLSQLEAALPAGVTVDSIMAQAADPAATTAATNPLQQSGAATLTFTASSTSLPSLPDLLNSLSTLPGFLAAEPSTVSKGDGDDYTISIVMVVDEKVYSHRYLPATKEGADK